MSTESAVFPWPSRLLSLVALVLWLVASVSGVCEVLASQSPDSAFHWGILPGPFDQLQSQSFWLGTLLMGFAWLWPHWVAPGRGLVRLGSLIAGACLQTASLMWAASNGMLAVQIADPRPDARLMFYVRALGHGLFLLGCCSFVPRAIRAALKGQASAATP